MAEILVEGGYDLAIHDPDLDPSRLIGVNFAVAAEHQATLMDRMTDDVEAAAAAARLIILGKPIPGVRERLPSGPPVLDITRLKDLG